MLLKQLTANIFNIYVSDIVSSLKMLRLCKKGYCCYESPMVTASTWQTVTATAILCLSSISSSVGARSWTCPGLSLPLQSARCCSQRSPATGSFVCSTFRARVLLAAPEPDLEPQGINGNVTHHFSNCSTSLGAQHNSNAHHRNRPNVQYSYNGSQKMNYVLVPFFKWMPQALFQ